MASELDIELWEGKFQMDMEEDKRVIWVKSDYYSLGKLLKVHMLETYPHIYISIYLEMGFGEGSGISQGHEGGAPMMILVTL